MSCSLPAPSAQEPFTLRAVTQRDVGIWYHVYSTLRYPATASTFSEGWGNSRFAPIELTGDVSAHTYYVASTPETAYMESVLHDVPLWPPGLFEVGSLRYYRLARLRLPPALSFVSFHTHDLPRLQGLDRSRLIDSLPVCYPQTRAWAQAALRQCPSAQAIGYGSRRNDAGRCLMLCRQRMPDPPFEILSDHPLDIGTRRAELLALVRSLGLHEI